jgi:hypothetical protein
MVHGLVAAVVAVAPVLERPVQGLAVALLAEVEADVSCVDPKKLT